VLHGDFMAERLGSSPGFFANLDVDFVGAHINNHVHNFVTVDGFQPDLIQLPSAGLEWTGSPTIQLGYRFFEPLGEVLLSYRFLNTQGTGTLIGFDLDGSDMSFKSRLDVNVIDLDYASPLFRLDPHWSMRYVIGGRIATVFFDSFAEGVFLEQRQSSNFVGGGPHAAVDFWRTLGSSRWGLFGRLEGSALFGQVEQSFEETFMTTDGSFVGGATNARSTPFVPTANVQIGLTYTRSAWSRFSLGYEFEQWWNIGNAKGSHADLTTNGVFLRGEFNF
jgi:hypothetical protein